MVGDNTNHGGKMEELKNEVSRLLNGESESDRSYCLSIIIDSGFKILSDKKDFQYKSLRLKDANTLFQMGLLKMISVHRAAERFEYVNPYDSTFYLPDMRDPFSVWPIVRSQFENYCNFNHLYAFHKNEEFANILYGLWAISGFKYRQKLTVASPENIEKKEREKENIESLIQEIKSNSFYTHLKSEGRDTILNAIKKKDWKLTSEDNRYVKTIHWQQMFVNAGCKNAMDSSYNYMSLNSHPTYVSIFQFAEMYKEQFHHSNTFFALRYATLIGSFLISDYCKLFSIAKASFDKLPIVNQLVINSHNRVFRGEGAAINDIDKQY